MRPFRRLSGTFRVSQLFFFVSGLLIYAAYLNSPGRTYFENRFLRLFPGLLVVSIAGVGLAVIAHGLPESKERVFQYILWLFSQVTIGQAYNPSIFRDIGVGVINGSLWSITVEILFYFSVPLIVVAERRFRYTVLLLLALSFFLGLCRFVWNGANAFAEPFGRPHP